MIKTEPGRVRRIPREINGCHGIGEKKTCGAAHPGYMAGADRGVGPGNPMAEIVENFPPERMTERGNKTARRPRGDGAKERCRFSIGLSRDEGLTGIWDLTPGGGVFGPVSRKR